MGTAHLDRVKLVWIRVLFIGLDPLLHIDLLLSLEDIGRQRSIPLVRLGVDLLEVDCDGLWNVILVELNESWIHALLVLVVEGGYKLVVFAGLLLAYELLVVLKQSCYLMLLL